MSHDSVGSGQTTLGQIQSIATIFSLVAVPVIVAILGALIQKSIQGSESRSKAMELAISILKEPPGRTNQPGLREWAIETLQESSPIQISETARKELATKPLFPMQPVQRNMRTGAWVYLELNKPFQMTRESPKLGEPDIPTHTFVLQRVGEDFVTLTVDGESKSWYVNDSLALQPEGCVAHLLGLGNLRTDAEVKSGRDDPTHPINSAFVAYVCP